MLLPKLEKSLLKQGYKYVVGIDEVGRGPVAGPLVFGAYRYELGQKTVPHVNDSKLVPPQIRSLLSDMLEGEGLSYILEVPHSYIDAVGMAGALHHGVATLTHFFRRSDTIIYIDGNTNYGYIDAKPIVQGDSKMYTIAAASIRAKVYRDNLMQKYAEVYPAYGFDRHKGYATRYHRAQIMLQGLCEIHRKSFNLNYEK